MADPLSITARIAGLLTFAGTTLTKGYSIARSLKDSQQEVTRLLAEVSQLTGILVALEAQEKEAKPVGHHSSLETRQIAESLRSSISSCSKVLDRVQEIFRKLGKSRRAVMAMKWQFVRPELETLIQEIEHHKNVFILCLGIDVRKKTDEMFELQQEITTHLRELRVETDKDRSAANEEKARSNRRALMRWLMPINDESHTKATRLSVPGTGNWLLEHPTFNAWVDGPNPLLWLNGIPGSGHAYFYCSYSESSSYDLSQVLQSLIAQLIRCFPEPETGPAMRLFEECDDGTLSASNDSMQSLFIDLINRMEIAYVCLDALDECKVDMKLELLQLMMLFMRKCGNIKVMISSRRGDSEVAECLEDCPCIEITPENVACDIELYVRHRIESGPKRLRLTQSDYMVEKLARGARGMFLWVSCQMDQLSRLKTTNSLEKALSSLPRDLYMTYDRILSCIPPENEMIATRALRWLAHAADPLNLMELVEAIVVDKDSSCLSNLRKLIIPEDIYQICGSLIRRSDATGVLDLAHQSVYEYLTAFQVGSVASSSKYSMPTSPSKVILAETCLTYLSFPDFDAANMYRKIEPTLNEQTIISVSEFNTPLEHPFLDHALKHWWKYIPTSEEGLDAIWLGLLQFFDNETGNFKSLIMVLNRLEGDYRYPLAMRPLHFCATNGLDSVSYRLLGDPTVDVECGLKDGRRALHVAAENGHEIVASQLKAHGADLDAKTADGRCPLQFALESGSESVSQMLIRGGANVNTVFSSGETPLSVTVANGWVLLMEILLGMGANPNGRLDDGRTPLHVAAEVGSDVDVISRLRSVGADPTLGDEKSWTALHYAARYGQKDVASKLMTEKMASGVFREVGWTPLHAAIEREHIEIVRLFADFGHTVSRLLSNMEDKGGSSLGAILAKSSSGKFQGTATNRAKLSFPARSSSFVRQNSPMDTKLPRECIPTPLFVAVSQGYIAGVEVLMTAGVTNNDLENCVQLAQARQQKEISELIALRSTKYLNMLINPNEYSSGILLKEENTLQFSCKSFQWNVRNLPIAMKTAIKHHDWSLFEALSTYIRQFDDPSRLQVWKELPSTLSEVVFANRLDILKSLHNMGVEVHRGTAIYFGNSLSPPSFSGTILHQAACLGRFNMVGFLLSIVSPKTMDSGGRTPLHYAAEHENSKTTLNALISYGASVTVSDWDGHTPLHCAARHGKEESILTLLEAGAQIEAFDIKGMTPLHHCAYASLKYEQYPPPGLQLLLHWGAATSALDKDGLEPLQLALVESIKASHSRRFFKTPTNDHALPLIIKILDQQADLLNARFLPQKRTVLHLAAEDRGSQVIDLLISRNADLEAEDADGKTPMQVASLAAQKLLIERGAQWRL